MNWSLLGWVFGGVATLYGIKFIFTLFSSLFGKEQRRELIAEMGDKIHTANENFTESLKKKAAERKAEKKRREAEKQKESAKVIGYIR